MKRMTTIMILGIAMLTLALSACAPATPMPETPGAPAALPEDVETAVKAALSAEVDVPAEDIEVVDAQHQEWPDACLGLARGGEMCAQVITPGWRVTLVTEGQEVVFRTDEAGDVIRMEE